jgi:two-component sensor histidine kinase
MSRSAVTLGAMSTPRGTTSGRANAAFVPRWFEIARKLHDLPIWAQYGTAAALVMSTLIMRAVLIGDLGGYHFVFFMPAVLLTSTVLAHGSGILAVLLSAVIIKLFFIPPPFSIWFTDTGDVIAILVFVGSGLVTAVMGSALHDALFRLDEANMRIGVSEREKELLLHELVHRFKNDLANVTAILRLQARSVSDPSARSELMVASDRIHVLTRVHQRLARFADITDVDVREFLEDLCEDLRVASIGLRPVRLETEVEQARLPFTTAVTVGLIVNELIQNALKYAFPADGPGTIAVRFVQSGDSFRLSVSDDGVGQAKPSAESSGLGQRLVASFAQQLGGMSDVQVASGRTVVVTFPASTASTR